MRRNIWKWVALVLLCAALLTACGSEKLQTVTGLVTELQVGDNGDLTAFVVRTGGGQEIGLLLTEETLAFPSEDGSWTLEELREAFQAALRPDVKISADCTRNKKTLTTDSGAQIPAYESNYIHITGRLDRGAAAMRDGTPVDVLEDSTFSRRTYRLADGTELLRVTDPHGPEHSYVGNMERFDDLSGMAREQVLAYYEKRGLLYDEQAELEKVYVLYQKLGADFRSGLVEQAVSPTASNDRVMYFITTVTLPTGSENGNLVYEIRLGDAFDRETGAHINTWDLFTASRETVIQAILEQSGVDGQTAHPEIETAPWDGHIVFFPSHLSVEFEPGALPGEDYGSSFSVDYHPVIRDLMQDWAIPES